MTRTLNGYRGKNRRFSGCENFLLKFCDDQSILIVNIDSL